MTNVMKKIVALDTQKNFLWVVQLEQVCKKGKNDSSKSKHI